MAKADPDYNPKTKQYSKAHNEAKYRKQREAAEKGAAGGNKADLQTAEKIYKKKYGNAKDIGTYNKKTSDLSEKYASKTDAHSKARGEAGGLAADEAETAANVFGGGPLGSAAKKVFSGTKNLARWGSAAARTGKEAEDAGKTVGKLKPRAPEAAPGGARTASTDKRTVTGNAPTTANKTVGNSKMSETKSASKNDEPAPKASAAPKSEPTAAPKPKATEAPKQEATPKPDKTAKPARTPAPQKTAAPGDSEAVAAYRTGTKGSPERKAAWSRMTKNEQGSWKAAQPKKDPTASTEAAPKKAKTPKATPAPAASAEVDFNKMSDSELAAYKKSGPKDDKGRVKMQATPNPDVAAKNQASADKIKANMKAKADAKSAMGDDS